MPNVEEDTAIDLVLRPGQMSFHHPRLVHGSQPNRTSRRRVGIALQSYLGPDVLPVRGAQPDEAFVSVSAPAAEVDAAGRATRAAANAALASVLYDGAEHRRGL